MKKIEYNGKKLLPPKSDIVFKGIFGMEPNDLLVDFLNNTLNLDIKGKEDILICNSDYEETDAFDLKVRTKDGLIDVEILVLNEKNVVQKPIKFYDCLDRRKVPEGAEFLDKSIKTVAVFISDYIIKGSIFSCHSIYKLLDVESETKPMFPIDVHTIELPKFDKDCYIDKSNKWIHFLAIDNEKDLEKVKEIDPIMSSAIDKLLQISDDEKIIMDYEASIKKLEAE